MTVFTLAPTADTSNHPDLVIAEPASEVRLVPMTPLRRAAQPDRFAASSPIVVEEATLFTSPATPTTAISQQPADGEDWVAAGREFLAELEREFGPVPDDVRAEVRQKWHD